MSRRTIPEEIRFRVADYQDPTDARAIRQLLDEYAQDPMGGSFAIPRDRLERLVGELARRPYAFSILAYDGAMAVALANCFEQFSTFQCRAIVNIHDLAVTESHRGRGIGRQMLREIEREAQSRGACKLTLEVLAGNSIAQRVYQSFGFQPYELRPQTGRAEFWQKQL